jgi:hypothetical protein
MSFEEYLQKAMELGYSSFAVSSHTNEETRNITFSIHPTNTMGARQRFRVTGNLLTPEAQPTFVVPEYAASNQ